MTSPLESPSPVDEGPDSLPVFYLFIVEELEVNWYSGAGAVLRSQNFRVQRNKIDTSDFLRISSPDLDGSKACQLHWKQLHTGTAMYR